MKKIKLNDKMGKTSPTDEYTLDPTEKYVINLDEEMEFQMAIMMSFQVMGPPPATMRGYLRMVLMWNYQIQQMRLLPLIMVSSRCGKQIIHKALL